MYEGREDNTEDTDEIDRLCGIIDGLRKEIAECRAEIAARKGEKICPSCGANVPKEACFCMRCGYSVAEEESGTENAGKEPRRNLSGTNTEEKTVNAEEAEQSEGGETAEAMKDTETKEEEK